MVPVERGARDPDAQNDLGMSYMEGEGVPQDNTYAHMWFNISASNESEKAAMNRGIVAKKMTKDQIAQAQKLARVREKELQGLLVKQA